MTLWQVADAEPVASSAHQVRHQARPGPRTRRHAQARAKPAPLVSGLLTAPTKSSGTGDAHWGGAALFGSLSRILLGIRLWTEELRQEGSRP